jgi:hypothetical protein
MVYVLASIDADNWHELVDDEKFEQVLYGPIAVCSSVEAAKVEAQRIYDEEVEAVDGETAALVWTDLAPEGTLQASGDEVAIVFQINPAIVVS